MTRINYDPRAAEANANRAQRAMLSASYREQVAKQRNAEGMRFAVLAGLAIGVVGSALQVFGVL